MADFDWNNYIFIDCETGGLDYRRHPLLEVTYAVGLNEPVTLYPSDVDDFALMYECEPEALKINGWDKYLSDPDAMPDRSIETDWDVFARALSGKFWVGANPRFDVNFVEEFFSPEPLTYNHRLFDIQTYFAGRKGLDIPQSFRKIVKYYKSIGWQIKDPDHTSRQDVIVTRQAFSIMLDTPIVGRNLPF